MVIRDKRGRDNGSQLYNEVGDKQQNVHVLKIFNFKDKDRLKFFAIVKQQNRTENLTSIGKN